MFNSMATLVPGGGFQAVIIFAAAIILYAMLFGLSTARKVINQTVIQLIAAIGVLLYGSVGIVLFNEWRELSLITTC